MKILVHLWCKPYRWIKLCYFYSFCFLCSLISAGWDFLHCFKVYSNVALFSQNKLFLLVLVTLFSWCLICVSWCLQFLCKWICTRMKYAGKYVVFGWVKLLVSIFKFHFNASLLYSFDLRLLFIIIVMFLYFVYHSMKTSFDWLFM